MFLSPCSRKRQVRNTGQPLTLLPSTSYTPDSPHSSSFSRRRQTPKIGKMPRLWGEGCSIGPPPILKTPSYGGQHARSSPTRRGQPRKKFPRQSAASLEAAAAAVLVHSSAAPAAPGAAPVPLPTLESVFLLVQALLAASPA